MNLITAITITCLFATKSITLAVEPQPPLDLKLDPDIIQPIGLDPKVDLLLVFPEDVTLITGQGLTTGDTPGKVQFQQGKENSKIVTLRLLDPEAELLMQVVLKKQVFVFRLGASERPGTVVRFAFDPKKNPAHQKAREVSKDQAKDKKTKVSVDRLKQMVDLVGKEPNLRPKLPQAYENYESIETSFTTKTVKGISLQVHRVGRFIEEDTLVFFGTLKNNSQSTYHHSASLAVLKVGSKRVFKKTKLLQKNTSTAPGKSNFVWVTLTGDGKGNPLHLSLQNQFTIQLRP